MIFEWETFVTDYDDLSFEGRECVANLMIAYNPDDDTPFRLHVNIFCDFERDTYHTRKDLERELRDLNKCFKMGMDVDYLLEEVDEFLAHRGKLNLKEKEKSREGRLHDRQGE